MGTSGTPVEYVILFCCDLYGCVPFIENTTAINHTKKVDIKERRAD